MPICIRFAKMFTLMEVIPYTFIRIGRRIKDVSPLSTGIEQDQAIKFPCYAHVLSSTTTSYRLQTEHFHGNEYF